MTISVEEAKLCDQNTKTDFLLKLKRRSLVTEVNTMRPVVATVWIHRAEASGIIVQTYSNDEAYKLSCDFLQDTDSYTIHEWDYLTFPDETEEGHCFHSGMTPSIQVSIHPGIYVPAAFWNARGTVLVTAHEALELGEHGEPEGFVPKESSGLWTKERRTHEELNQELADYFRLGELELKQTINELMKYAGIFGELAMADMLRSKDIDYLNSELTMAKNIYKEMNQQSQINTDRLTLEIQDYFLRPEDY